MRRRYWWWDDALRVANDRAALTGLRQRVQRVPGAMVLLGSDRMTTRGDLLATALCFTGIIATALALAEGWLR